MLSDYFWGSAKYGHIGQVWLAFGYVFVLAAGLVAIGLLLEWIAAS